MLWDLSEIPNGFEAATPRPAALNNYVRKINSLELPHKQCKWVSCLSTVTTTACGFVFGRESLKADLECVGYGHAASLVSRLRRLPAWPSSIEFRAPSAMRLPNSLVRCTTAHRTTL